ncbi:2-C-methyl-D-erythritol 4-phosphate cytidylyltransferase [Nocardioides sp. AE5]|uniref:2-C-methyl-D-erythritol 4-phosphate cytidylyltransferase n=1 Tax=Nocardioides sp. AE5 TaxID=2962573 RepID=UPI002881975E|nr:2-C-methyl-D-erythritol 4-phosphate cytidylyltransferase [Nocardioides sp. AE5]MDT0200602.1 2-C-methyl-D-erythritol 4-phosphate cytidylyltransferase [Nocardioides sp. AE5]
MSTVAVVLAGGIGTRMGAEVPKQLLELAGRPLLAHTLASFEAHDGIDEVLVLMAPDFLARAEEIAAGFTKVSRVLPGADSRHATTRAALAALEGAGHGEETQVVLHDAARPLVGAAVIDRCLAALATYDALTTAIASADTIVEIAGPEPLLASTPERSTLRRVQTPQCFRLGVIRRAHALAEADPGFAPTDDATVVRRYLPQVPVAIVEGDERNLKVTTPTDLLVAERLLAQ